MLTVPERATGDELTFCGWSCLSEFVEAKTLIDGATEDGSPPA